MIVPLTRKRHGTESTSLAQQAYQQIREKILKGEFAVGDALPRRELADRLHMSFLPISEALQRLEAEGLVESKPRVGTRVRVPTEQDIRERYELREALESHAARLFARSASAAEKGELSRMAGQLDRLHEVCASETVDSEFLYSVHTYHMGLHMRIAEWSRCALLRDAIEKEQVLVFNWLYDATARRITMSANFHADLARALNSGDPLQADAEMRHHIRFGLDPVLAELGSAAPPDGWRLKKPRKSESSEV